MKSYLKLFSFVISLTLGVSVLSHAAKPPVKNKTDAYYLAIKGGVSLGSYETGLNRTILKYVQNRQDSKLIAFAGASAGSINSVMSAIDACIIDKRIKEDSKHSVKGIDDTLDNNFMQVGWDIGINDLVPTKKGENNYKTLYDYDDENKLASDVGMFSRNSFNEKKSIFKELVSRDAKPDCNLTITMSITKFDAYEHSIDLIGTTIRLQRFVVPIDVYVDQGKLKFKNSDQLHLKEAQKKNEVPSQYLLLIEKADGTISFDEIWNLALASSAFPLAFHPVEVSFCLPHEVKGKRCVRSETTSALFSDGGLFDNSPIGVAWDIAEDKVAAYKDTKLIFINPDSYRDEEKEDEKEKTKKKKRNVGLSEYKDYFAGSLLTAHESIYTSSLNAILSASKKSKARHLFMTSRYHHLLADLHAHFGAFYASEYRMHDYLVGVYDGANLIAELTCNENYAFGYSAKRGSVFQECVNIEVDRWISELPNGGSQSVNFIRYLYNTEHYEHFSDKESQTNPYVALSQSFGPYNKKSSATIEYTQYLINLKHFGSNLNLKKGSDLYVILNNGKTYTSKKISKMYENIMLMQDLSADCESCEGKEFNTGLGTAFKVAEPLVDSYLSHHESNVWPKSFAGVIGVSYGFNVNQKNQVYSLEYRPTIEYLALHELSIDFGINYHDFGGELKDDDYESYSVSLVKHNDNLYVPTIGLGYQHESPGKNIYDETLNSAFINFAFFNELLALKYLHRLDDVKPFAVSTRDDRAFVVSIDVSKIYQMFSASWR